MSGRSRCSPSPGADALQPHHKVRDVTRRPDIKRAAGLRKADGSWSTWCQRPGASGRRRGELDDGEAAEQVPDQEPAAQGRFGRVPGSLRPDSEY